MKNALTLLHGVLLRSFSLAALSLAVSAPAQAVTIWRWSFTGNFSDQFASGTFTTEDVDPEANTTYTIIGITGTYNLGGQSYQITGLSDYQGATNTFQWNGTSESPLISDGDLRGPSGGIAFSVADGNTTESVLVFYNNQGDYGPVNDTSTSFPVFSTSISSSSVQPVPFESDALPLAGATLFMAGGLWWKKKRAQAKVTDFVAKK